MNAAHAGLGISPADEYGLGKRRQTLAIIEANAVSTSVTTVSCARLGDVREHALANLLNQHLLCVSQTNAATT